MYDYLIVGSGLFGAVFAHEATQRGKKCLVIERRSHIGGNVYTERLDNIDIIGVQALKGFRAIVKAIK